jgi:SagB-type dehydrogenase family enzyme
MTTRQFLDRIFVQDEFLEATREQVEVFHETTKLSRSNIELFGARVVEYSERAMREAARNRRYYPLARRIKLPAANGSARTLETCLEGRRSRRTFTTTPLSLQEVANVLGAARARKTVHGEEGVTLGLRAYPSAGGLYPIETYVALLGVEGMASCCAHYDPFAHELQIIDEALTAERFLEALGAGDPPLANMGIFPCALFERSYTKYGERGHRFAMLEAGMLGFVYDLAATDGDLATLHWGGFYDDDIHVLFGLDGVRETVVDCLLIGNAE